MTVSLQFIMSVFTAVGIGGILGAYFQSRFQHKKDLESDMHTLKRARYGAILIQMLTVLDPKVGLPKVKEIRPDLATVDDFKEEIKTELLNSVLFASDEVIRSMAGFVRDPSYAAYVKTASSMRRDLWGRKTAVDEDLLDVFTK